VRGNAGIPTRKAVMAARRGQAEGGIFLYFLPAYSPEVNRIEPVFELVKHHDMPPRRFTSRADLRVAVEAGFATYRRRLPTKWDKGLRRAA
jgi:transposase